MKECLICFDTKNDEEVFNCFNIECSKTICNECLNKISTSSGFTSKLKKQEYEITFCPFCKNPFNSYLKLRNNVFKICGMDMKNELWKLEDDYGYSYSYFGSTVRWEGYPPNCKKCDKPENTQMCPRTCYNFNTDYTKKDLIKIDCDFDAEDNTKKMNFS